MWNCRLIVAICLSIVCCESQLSAAIFSGTISSVSPEKRQVKVTKLNGKASMLFKIPASVRISKDKKSASLKDFSEGDRVVIYTDNTGKVTRLKSSSANFLSKPRPRPKQSQNSRIAKLSTVRSRSVASSSEWSQFRGPNRENKSAETGLLKQWPAAGPPLLWTTSGLGEGYSAVSLANNMIYTMGTTGGEEKIFALNLADGEIAWSVTNSNRVYKNGQGNGPRGTPAIDEGKLYALGGHGDLSCVDLVTHQIVWSRNILKDFQGRNISWGISESVLIDGEKLICTPGGKNGTIVALNKNDGSVIWRSNVPSAPSASYSSPIVVEVGGVKQYVNFVSNAVVGVRAADGTPLWSNNRSANRTANCSAPLFYNGQIFSSSGYGTGGALLKLSSRSNKTNAQFVYHTKDMKSHHGGMVVVDGYIYGTNEQVMTCMEMKTGEIKWKSRSPGKGSITYADGFLYVRSESGPVALVEATPKRHNETGKFKQPNRSNRRAWAHPVVADGKLFLRDMDNLLVYNVKSK